MKGLSPTRWSTRATPFRDLPEGAMQHRGTPQVLSPRTSRSAKKDRKLRGTKDDGRMTRSRMQYIFGPKAGVGVLAWEREHVQWTRADPRSGPTRGKRQVGRVRAETVWEGSVAREAGFLTKLLTAGEWRKKGRDRGYIPSGIVESSWSAMVVHTAHSSHAIMPPTAPRLLQPR